MNRAEEIRELFAFNRWANARILHAAVGLPEEQQLRDLGSSYPSIRHQIIRCRPSTYPSSRERTRTSDPVINSHLLYQLSYAGSSLSSLQS